MHEGRFNLSRICRAALPVALWMAALLASPLAVSARGMEISTCYSDPVVYLSNGVTLDLSATIGDIDGDVTQVAYTLNIPAGTSVVSVTNTSGPLGPKETFRATAGNAANTYTSVTTVYTGSSPVPVDASTSAVGPIAVATGSITGRNNQHLPITVNL